MNNQRLTIERLREILHYDPETGVFRWRMSIGGTSAVGKVAGGARPDGYVSIRIDRCNYYAHVLAWAYMTGEWASCHVDHRDTDPSNNCWLNLREATVEQNNQNRRVKCTCKSGAKGIWYYAQKDRWRATLSVNGKQVFSRLFRTRDEAIRAYAEAAQKFHGEFARAA